VLYVLGFVHEAIFSLKASHYLNTLKHLQLFSMYEVIWSRILNRGGQDLFWI
jgi:hypothetical protein